MHSPAVTPQLFMTASRCFGCESRQLYTIFSDLASAFTDFIVFLLRIFTFYMEEIQHILRFRHDPRSLCNQPVAALTERIDAPSRQRKYLFSLFQRQIRRNQGAASFRASTTSTRSESPLMIRFRIGKWDAVGGTPGPYSDNMPPCSRMRACSRMPDGG